MRINDSLTDDAVLTELGERIARARVRMNLTQAQLASQAGIGKRTLERMESGGSSQLTSLIRVMRVLGLLADLDSLLPAPAATPMELLRGKGKRRQRVRASGKTQDKSDEWHWADES